MNDYLSSFKISTKKKKKKIKSTVDNTNKMYVNKLTTFSLENNSTSFCLL